MGVPRSRFLLFHRLVLLPPLMVLTLTCLYTSSTLSPFSATRRHSFSQELQCFSCEPSSFPSRSFLSLANFPASSYIREVVLRHSALKVEDSRGETSDPVSRRGTNELESGIRNGRENADDEIDSHPDTTWRAKEEVDLPKGDDETSVGIVIREQKLFDDNPMQQDRREEDVHATEEQRNASPKDEKLAKGGDSVSRVNAGPTEENTDNSTPSENEADNSFPKDTNGVDSSVQIVEFPMETNENFKRGKDEEVPSSVPEENSEEYSVQVVEHPTKTKDTFEEGKKEDSPSSVPREKNVEVFKENEKNSEGGRKEEVHSSVPEEETTDSSFQVLEVSNERKENFEGGRQEDLLLENRHLTSDDASSDDDHNAPIEANVSVSAAVLEPTVERAAPVEAKKKEVMRFGFEGMSEELRTAGIEVQNHMDSITRSGLPTENGNSQPDAKVDVNLLLRGGSPQGVPLPEGRSCEGRQVFVYNLPSKFNADLVGQCNTLLQWFDFCEYFMNEGMGSTVATDELNDRGEKVLVPDGSWFLTHQYALELLFHARLKHYPCITHDVNVADLFFVPYYAGLDVIRWHFQPNVSNDQRDKLTFELISWLEGQEAWSRNNGMDHVFVLGKIGWDFRRDDSFGKWGSKLLLLPSMKAPAKVLIERDPWHSNDIGVPHPTFFHPKDDGEIRTWLDHVQQSERRYLVSFAGMPRPNMLGNVRGHLIQQCLANPDDCFLLRCENNLCLRPDSTMNLFLHSHFCMQPPGDSPTRRSVFDSLVGGCIPVLFDPYSAYYQYPWHLPQNASSYSVFIPSPDVMSGKADIVGILKSISPEERTAMRTRIIREIIPGLLYSQPGTKLSDFRDAFDISIDALLHRVANLRAKKLISM